MADQLPIATPPATDQTLSPPIVGTISGIPPVAVAEPGMTTSEWKLAIGGLAAVVVSTAVAFGVHLNAEQQAAILSLIGAIVLIVSSYIVSRGVRKSGTTA